MTVMSRTTLTIPLAAAGNADQCGAKASRLADMLKLGFAVPSGFVVTDLAFQRWLDESRLRRRIDKSLAIADSSDPLALAQVAKDIRQWVLAAAVPADVASEVLDNAKRLGTEPFVVRSSAIGEDSKDAAFAGQLDSFLHVREHDLIDGLHRCWASYWSHRSLAYQRGRSCSLQGMGVLIQQQTNSCISGVLFTRGVRQPRSGSMIAEFCRGLGDELVSGRVRPRRLTLAQDHWEERDQDGVAAETPLITDALAGKLYDAGRSLESHFDTPLDIEWTVDAEGDLQLLQSRPITAFAESRALPFEPTGVAENRIVWSNANVNENFPEPICPLLYSIASKGYYHYFRNLGLAFGISAERVEAMEYPLRNIIGSHGGRLYYNLTNIHAVLRSAPFGEFLSESFNQFVGAKSAPAPANAGSPLHRDGRLRQARELVRIAMRTWWRFRNLERRVEVFESQVDAFSQASHPCRLAQLTTTELLDLWRGFIQIRSHWTDAAAADASSMISYGLSQRLLQREFPDATDSAMANRLLTGLRDVVSGLPTERLWDLARQFQRDPELRTSLRELAAEDVLLQIESDARHQPLHRDLQQFLEQWGFRCSGELMLTEPSYQERPAAVLELIRAYLDHHGCSPQERLARQQQSREEETDRVLKILARRRLLRFLPWPRKNLLAKRLFRWTQRSIACRERARLKQALLYSRCRRLTLAIGQRLADAGGLEDVTDLFFLTHEEIESLLAGGAMLPEQTSALARLRRTAQQNLAALSPPDRFDLEPGCYWDSRQDREHGRAAACANQDGDGRADPSTTLSKASLSGIGVCGGQIVGRAVVLSDPSQLDQVQAGDILVTRQTDPGWGPILFLVSGLVMERGGMLSHGAILAREYGLPTVVEISNATGRITSGQQIQVDGERGVVEILD